MEQLITVSIGLMLSKGQHYLQVFTPTDERIDIAISKEYALDLQAAGNLAIEVSEEL